MHALRVGVAIAGLVLLCLSAVVGVIGGSRLAVAEVDNSLTARALENATAIEEYFERARAIDLLLANMPAFAEHFRTQQDGRAEGGRGLRPAHQHSAGAGAEERRRMEQMLQYLEQIYPTQIGEACVIDRRGVEIARVVRGTPAEQHDLSHEEADNEFFHAAFALAPGEVYQSAPYVSPDTGEWVISNSTQVPVGDGASPALVHFEITVDSFREHAERTGSDEVAIIERSTGRILLQTGERQEAGDALGFAPTDLSRAVASMSSSGGVLTVGEQRAAYRAVPAGGDNQNDWIVVASARDAASPWSTGPGKAAIAAAIGAAILLMTAIHGFRTYQRELRHRASTDALTGLANRAVLHERLTAALLDRRHRGTSALLLLDLDGFKEVNDTLGHGSGDDLLSQVGRRIQHEVRARDLAARLGGDEFAILVEDLEDEEALERMTQRILAAIRRPYRLSGVGMHLDASIGVAIIGRHGRTPELLVQRADVAMYQAKSASQGVVVYDPARDPHSASKLGLTAGLLEAIEQRTIQLHYQPQMRLRDGAVTGVEALVRWTHPQHGPLPPGDFIPMAEKTGLIRLLTRCVLDLALLQCRQWLEEGRHLPVAVNCSAVDLADEQLAQTVRSLLRAHEVPAELLRLEITESAIMADPCRAYDVLQELHEMGVELIVDDYGTGNASLSYLKSLPVCELKIDRAFISSVHEEPVDGVIVRSTIELGHRLGMRIVAEGVEDEEALRFLGATGCDFAQGFHVAPPLPPDQLGAWLDRHEASRALSRTF